MGNEKPMNQPEEKELYRVENRQIVQGQVIGNQNIVHQYLGSGSPHTKSPSLSTPIWNVPFHRNPFFTGREELFPVLHRRLTSGNMTALAQPQALSGLGGIGKTAITVEYVYRYRQEYEAILWIQAESWEMLISECVKVATLLGLPPEKKAEKAVEDIQNWLRQHHQWLLILDNLEETQILTDFVPTGHQGSVLITTRIHTIDPLAQTEVLSTLSEQESVLFLLRRTKEKADPANPDLADEVKCHEAQEISLLMDGLPLALDQAGAYISETGCSLASYKSQYIERRAELLQRRGKRVIDHAESVETTFSLSYERVKRANTIAADILLACAFLQGDAIPEELFWGEIPYLGHRLTGHSKDWNEAMEILLDYSLVTRNSDDAALRVHKLVQSVLQDKMNAKNRTKWGRRVVLALEQIFPSSQYGTWHLCERLLPHVFAVSALIQEDWTSQFEDGRATLIQAARLLSRAGQYLYNQAQYTTAEHLLEQALKICTRQLGRDHPTSISRASDLAALYAIQGRYKETEPLLQKNVEYLQEAPGEDLFAKLHVHYPDKEAEWNHLYATKALTMNNLAMLYLETKKYTKARDLFKQVLKMYQKHWDMENTGAAKTMSNIAETYRQEGSYQEAEPLFKQALTIIQQMQGKQHPDFATSLHNLSTLHYSQGNYSEAELLSIQALIIYEQTLGPMHPETVAHLNDLVKIYCAQGKYEAADPFCQRLLATLKQTKKSTHLDISVYLNGLASLFADEGKEKEAEKLYQYVLAIQEKHGDLFTK